MIHLATGIAVRDGRLLLVASRYRNHAQPLWNLPGGRQLPGELLSETVTREMLEETGLRAQPREVAYVSESYDGDAQYLNVTFQVAVTGWSCAVRTGEERDHVTAVEWVPLAELRERIAVAVVREPLLAYLSGSLAQRYAGFHDAGITIEWPEDSR